MSDQRIAIFVEQYMREVENVGQDLRVREAYVHSYFKLRMWREQGNGRRTICRAQRVEEHPAQAASGLSGFKSGGGVDASATSPPVPLPEKAGVMHPVPHGRAAVAGARRAFSEPSICFERTLG